jgi:hypothetical protein
MVGVKIREYGLLQHNTMGFSMADGTRWITYVYGMIWETANSGKGNQSGWVSAGQIHSFLISGPNFE